MKFKSLLIKPTIQQDKKLMERFEAFKKFTNELEKKDVPIETINAINRDIEEINSFPGSANDLLKYFRKKQSAILKMLEKELKLVTKNHYRNMWLPLGLAAFGIPLGLAFGLSVGNMGLLGAGMPIGMLIGMAVGSSLDKKAKEAGKQLDVELKY